jgi:hypothetical protein
MITENEIREKLGRYLSKDLSLDSFEDWLAQRSWNMHLDSDPAAQKLASAIELRLAEFSNGHLDESALRDDLRPFVSNYTVKIWFGAPPALVSEEPPNNVFTDLSPEAFQVAFPDPAVAPQVVTKFFDTTLLAEHG